MAVMTPPTTAMESRRKWSRRRVDRLAVSSKRVTGLDIRNVHWLGDQCERCSGQWTETVTAASKLIIFTFKSCQFFFQFKPFILKT